MAKRGHFYIAQRGHYYFGLTGALAALTPRQRGRKLRALDAQGARVTELEREVERLRQRLLQAETIIEVQKKVSLLLGIDPSPLVSAGRP